MWHVEGDGNWTDGYDLRMEVNEISVGENRPNKQGSSLFSFFYVSPQRFFLFSSRTGGWGFVCAQLRVFTLSNFLSLFFGMKCAENTPRDFGGNGLTTTTPQRRNSLLQLYLIEPAVGHSSLLVANENG